MVENAAEVRIWDNPVGAVLWDNTKGYASFEYDPNFLKLNYDLAPLTMTLKQALAGKRIFEFPRLNFETYHGLPGMLSDSLPDKFGTQLINSWLAQQGRGVGSINPIERLCYTGKRGMGALEYNPPIKIFESMNKPIEIDRLVSLASEVLSERKQFSTNFTSMDDDSLKELIQVGTSAGGARAKAVIAYNKSTGDVRSGQIDNLRDYEYWIIKLDGVTNEQLGDPLGYGKIEYAYYLMAKDCGINMANCRLMIENGRAHFMTKRFDRKGLDKIHMQSLCGIAHYDYNDPGAYSYEQAFQVLRKLRLPYPDSAELFRRMCFNVVARNQDDHTKNVSFLMGKDCIWELSPAYDMTYAYNPSRKWTKQHQMSINGKRENILREDILAVGTKMNIKNPKETIDKVIEIVSNWTKYAKNAEVDSEKIKAIQETLELSI